jgi:hypothetical protein
MGVSVSSLKYTLKDLKQKQKTNGKGISHTPEKAPRRKIKTDAD